MTDFDRDAHLPADPRDYVLDLSGLAPAPDAAADAASSPPPSPPTDSRGGSGSPFLSIHFKCCNVYARIYPTSDLSAFAGHCPKCARPVRIRIGPGGTTERQFVAE